MVATELSKRNRSKPFIDGTIKSFVEGIAGAAIFLLVYFNFLPDSKVYLLSLIVLLFTSTGSGTHLD